MVINTAKFVDNTKSWILSKNEIK